MPSHTSDPREKGDREESGWTRDFIIGQVVILVAIAVTLAFALVSEDRGLASIMYQRQASTGAAVGIGSEFAAPESPVECADNEALARDCAALLSIGSALAGDAGLNWGLDAPVSDWDGVIVGGQPFRVIALNLTTSGLIGTVPPELGGLSELRSLHLYGNRLSGEIPPELGRLSKLDTLDLGDNDLTGAIPPEIGRLSALVSLDLSVNRLSGRIPARLGELERLEWLVIADNELMGSITETLESLSNLEYVNIEGNDFAGCVPARLRDVDGFLGDIAACAAP